MAKNDNLRKAKEAKNDEFYTQLDDIVAEIAQHKDYVRQFQGKTVFCNCDDPEWSAFVEFFRKFFKKLGLKKMICTHYEKDGSPSYKLEWSGEKIRGDTVNMIKTPLKGNGDFRSEECIELLKEADIVVTNPPFSLFREYVAQLMEYDKEFVIIGNMNAIAYKEIFPLLRDNKVSIGYASGSKTFRVNDDYNNSSTFVQNGVKYAKFGNICWFTNLDLDKSHEPLILTKNFTGNEDKYPKYDNYDAIDVPSIAEIPKDYFGLMGVPITYMAVHCADQFDIIASSQTGCHPDSMVLRKYKDYRGYKPDGSSNGRTGSTCSNNPMLLKNDGKHAYYMNKDGRTVQSTFSKLFIQRKLIVQED